MNDAVRNLARMIDLSAVQAQNTREDILAVANLAKRYNIIAVHVLPCWSSFLRDNLPPLGDIYVVANEERITLRRRAFSVAESVPLRIGSLRPFLAGEQCAWSLEE